MKALVYTAVQRVELQDIPVPPIGSDEVLVRVGAVGICGSEVEAYLGKSRKRVPPLVMGHEFTGTVEKIGDGVEGVASGSRVAVQPLLNCHNCPECNTGRTNICRNRKLMSIELPGGYAEYAAVPASALFPLAESVSMETGTLAEPLANAVHILERVERRLLARLVVLGGGTIGALVAMLARSIGIRSIAMVEPNSSKHDLLRAIGCELVLDPRDESALGRVVEWSGGGADIVVDASGAAQARKFAIECAAPGAGIVFVGQGSASSDADHRDILTKELNIKGSYAYTNFDFARALELLESNCIDATAIITTIAMDQGPAAFAEIVGGASGRVKFVMIP